jgi:hypothetical protein
MKMKKNKKKRKVKKRNGIEERWIAWVEGIRME